MPHSGVRVELKGRLRIELFWRKKLGILDI